MASDEFHQIMYRWTGSCPFDDDAELGFWPVAWTFGAPAALRLWHDRIRMWLRTDPGGAPEPSLFYSVFDDDAVAIRRDQRPSVANATAHLLIAPQERLTARLALELQGWDRMDVQHDRLLHPGDLTAHRDPPDITDWEERTLGVLIPALSEMLAVSGPIPVPAGEETPRVLWVLDEILQVLSTGLPVQGLSLSFDTYSDQPDVGDRPGFYLRFRPGLAPSAANPATAEAARILIETYREDRANGVRALCHRARILEGRSLPERLGMLTRLNAARATAPGPGASPPRTPSFSGASGATMPPSFQAAPSTATEDSQDPSAPDPSRNGQVSCPICLGRLTWHDLSLYRYDIEQDDYVEVGEGLGTTPEQIARQRRNTYVRCPNPGETAGDHYLPANYGRHGPPAVFGLIGASNSGKSHLLATMVGAIEQSGLGHGVRAHPIDQARHQRYMRDTVRPLLTQSRRIAPTQENIVQFVDGFVVSGAGVPRDGTAGNGAGAEATRPMALFDVAGSELAEVEDAKRFLELANGLIFVADPELWQQNTLDDATFSTVLNLLRDSGQLSKVSATVVLAKADLLRFEDPIAFWLREDGGSVTAEQALRESEEVYAYLHQRDARAWTRPYDECPRASLHVASALGSAGFDRPVRPLRVLRPLIALMAMTGVLAAPGTEDMGI